METRATKKWKREYDRRYREKNKAALAAKKKAYYAATGPLRREKGREYRQRTMHRHVEYCRRPEYKAWKRRYDQEYRAKQFGDFGEAQQLLVELLKIINQQEPNRFIRYAQSQRHGWNPINQARRRNNAAERKQITNSI